MRLCHCRESLRVLIGTRCEKTVTERMEGSFGTGS